MMRTALFLLTVTAALGLLASAGLAGMAAAGAPLPSNGLATLVTRLALFPAMLAAMLVHWPAVRRRRGPDGAEDDRASWSRLLVSAPAPLVLLQRGLLAWVIVDVVRSAIAAVTGWPIAPLDTNGEVDPWSIWVFLWAVSLSLAVVALRRARPGRSSAG
ncbi:hypothetical protein [Rhodoplanes azumiensis]|uniref:Uncharacterized protein n=1 Tax=Rhodoplanes azumiensis TaxID=1897628 RepID=A0ABW5ACQ9_9BRAD